MSVDGFIATENDDLSWLSLVQKVGLDYGYSEMVENSDTYLVGRKTYDIVKELCNGEFPQSKMFDCYIITRQDLPNADGVTFYNKDIKYLISELKSKPGKNIYCDGGGQLVEMLMQKDLIDEYIISVIPTLLGKGKRLFLGNTPPINIKLKKCESFETGLVQLHYQKTNQ